MYTDVKDYIVLVDIGSFFAPADTPQKEELNDRLTEFINYCSKFSYVHLAGRNIDCSDLLEKLSEELYFGENAVLEKAVDIESCIYASLVIGPAARLFERPFRYNKHITPHDIPKREHLEKFWNEFRLYTPTEKLRREVAASDANPNLAETWETALQLPDIQNLIHIYTNVAGKPSREMQDTLRIYFEHATAGDLYPHKDEYLDRIGTAILASLPSDTADMVLNAREALNAIARDHVSPGF